MNVFYDEAGAIGRRYRRQDEAGTPFCVTIDFDTLEGEKAGELAGQKDTVTRAASRRWPAGPAADRRVARLVAAEDPVSGRRMNLQPPMSESGVSSFTAMTQSARISYVIMAVLLVLIGWFHLGTLVLTALFGYFALATVQFWPQQNSGSGALRHRRGGDRLGTVLFLAPGLHSNCRRSRKTRFRRW